MQELCANTQVIVPVGPFVDVGDGFTPETGVTLGAADEAELLKHGSTSVVDISGATWAAVTNCRGYYSLTLTASHTDTEGTLAVIVQDDSVCLPVKQEFMVLSEAAWNSKYAPKDAGFMDVNIKTIGRADTQETEANNLESACSNYSATRGLTGTALPAAAADAAGGVPISDAGGLDIDAKLANTNEVTAARMAELSAENLPLNIDNLLARLTAARGGYLDKLNITGNVAGSAEVTAIQNNTRVRVIVPPMVERPDSGSTAYELHLYIYDTEGNMEAPDSLPTIAAANQAGTDRSGNLGTVTLDGTGHYTVTYTVASDHAIEQVHFEWTVVEGGLSRLHGSTAQIVDTTAVDFTSSDRSDLQAVKAKTDDLAFTGTDVHATLDGETVALAADQTGVTVGQVNALGTQAKADINAEADAALADIDLDHLSKNGAAPTPTAGSLLDKIMNKDGGQTFSQATDALEAIRDNQGGGGETQLRTGTAQAGAAGTITLDSGASAVTDFYKHCICALTGGTGAGQSQIVDSYNGTSKVATMAANWATAPDNTTTFVLLPLGTIPGASAPTAAQNADAVLAELVGDHKGTSGSLADVVNRIRAATAARKIVNHAGNGTIKIYDTDGVSLLHTLTIQAGATDDEVELVGS